LPLLHRKQHAAVQPRACIGDDGRVYGRFDLLADTAKERTKAVKNAIRTAVTKWDFLQTRV